jgi:hypothetical protein
VLVVVKVTSVGGAFW